MRSHSGTAPATVSETSPDIRHCAQRAREGVVAGLHALCSPLASPETGLAAGSLRPATVAMRRALRRRRRLLSTALRLHGFSIATPPVDARGRARWRTHDATAIPHHGARAVLAVARVRAAHRRDRSR